MSLCLYICAMNANLRERILYYPAYPDDPGHVTLPLICRSVTRFGGPPGARGNDVAKPYWHLEWVIDGTLLMQTAEAKYRISAGQAIMVPPGLQRRFAAAEPLSGRGISMVGDQAGTIIRAFGYTHPGILQSGQCPESDYLQLEELIGGMTGQEMRAASAATYRILTKAFRGADDADSGDPPDPLVSRALRLLDTAFGNPAIDINWLAAQLGCHRSHLSHRFREQIGMPPGEYLMRRRLQKAMTRLRMSDDKVAGIADECGFSSPDYFSRIFRTKIGVSPTTFRTHG